MDLTILAGLGKVVAVGGLMAGGAGAVFVVSSTTNGDESGRFVVACGFTPAGGVAEHTFTQQPETATPVVVMPAPREAARIPAGWLVPIVASQGVEPGDEITMEVWQSASEPAVGVQADVVFDPTVLQVTAAGLGHAYDGALFLHGIAPEDQEVETGDDVRLPWAIDDTIARANQTGTLENLAAYFVPGAGAVAPLDPGEVGTAPPGEGVAFVVRFRPLRSQVPTTIRLTEPEMLSVRGDAIGVSPGETTFVLGSSVVLATMTTGASETPSPDAPASSSPTAEPTCTPTPEANAPEYAGSRPSTATPAPSGMPPTSPPAVQSTPMPGGDTSTPSAPQAGWQVQPALTRAQAGDLPSVTLIVHANTLVSGAQASFSFDPTVMQIVRIVPLPDIDGATVLVGVAPQTMEEAIAEANRTGTLNNLAFVIVPGTRDPLGLGQHPAFAIELQIIATSDTTSALVLDGVEMIGADGCLLRASAAGGLLVIGEIDATIDPGPYDVIVGEGADCPPPTE